MIYTILISMSLYSHIISSPVWDLIAIASDEHLLLLEFSDWEEVPIKIKKIENQYNTKKQTIKNPILERVEIELSEYFSGNRKEFTLSFMPKGTDFQVKAWKALEKIPYGETRNYLEEATLVGNPKAVRAIGGANHNNPIVIVIPCHRVIGKSGKLVWYGGWLDRKIWLLEHEKKHK